MPDIEFFTKYIIVKTKKAGEYYDITQNLIDFSEATPIRTGLMIAYSLHTTTGVVINEGSDPGVGMDVSEVLWQLIPEGRNWHHTEETPLDAASHVKAQIIGNSVFLGIENGKLVLGPWQRVYFIEYNEPRERKVFVLLFGNKK
ncbi:MAG: secondary thiamine-phosphate synthase enzyme YjbQ [Candidatus Thorarchaeota archaeon]